jgi:flagellar protein FliO/FliZ
MDIDIYLRSLLAFVVVLALIAAAALAARRLGLGGGGGSPGRRRRTSIVEVTPLDAKRRLVLIRRDDVEHLLLLGAVGDHVIERGISTADRPAGADTGEPAIGAGVA